MNRSNIEAFIALTKEKNIVKAADSLYLSPSTVSTQLKVLENELGIKLFERHKGHKTITLTPKGEAFTKIAYDFLALLNECGQLKNADEKSHLSIATADSFLAYNLAPLYREMVFGDAKFNLEIKLHPADMIYSLVSKKEVDLGFVTYHINYPDVITEEVFSDDMVVLVPKSSALTGDIVHPLNLDPEKELIIGSPQNKHIGCGAVFNTWRTTWIDAQKTPLVRANSISVLYHFLSSDCNDFWMFAPKTTALGLMKDYDLRMLKLDAKPPKRVCYKLTHVSPTETVRRNIDKFNLLLSDYIDKADMSL
ncbi:LysR family transcriptional regulator [Agathobacter sp.]